MKSETKEKLSGDAHSNRVSTTRTTGGSAKRENAFWQVIIGGSNGTMVTCFFHYLILK